MNYTIEFGPQGEPIVEERDLNRQQRADDDDDTHHFYGAWNGQPRDPDGKFASGGGGAKTQKDSGGDKPTKADSRAALEGTIRNETDRPEVTPGIEQLAERGMDPSIVSALGPLRVRDLDDAKAEKLGDASGLYTQNAKGGTLELVNSGDQYDRFIHEYGHHVTFGLDAGRKPDGFDTSAYRASKSDAKAEFVAAVGTKGLDLTSLTASQSKDIPTAYAAYNFDEWRAESFLMYVKGGSDAARLQKIAPDTYGYVKGCVTNNW